MGRGDYCKANFPGKDGNNGEECMELGGALHAAPLASITEHILQCSSLFQPSGLSRDSEEEPVLRKGLPRPAGPGVHSDLASWMPVGRCSIVHVALIILVRLVLAGLSVRFSVSTAMSIWDIISHFIACVEPPSSVALCVYSKDLQAL